MELGGPAVSFFNLIRRAGFSNTLTRYRILAELLEQGTHTTLALPSHRPAAYNTTLYSSTAQNPSSSRGSTPALETDALRSLGLNPSHALQHPGFYYYMAARCTEMRRERFLITFDADVGFFSFIQVSYLN